MTRTERIVLRGGRLAESGAVADIAIEDGRIAEIASREPGSTPRLSGDRTIDAEGLVVFPGLIDLQVNDIEWLAGGLRDPETHAERVRAVCRHHAARGITGICLATLAAPLDEILAYLAGMAIVLDEPRGSVDNVFLGGLVEGTFMNPEFHGAHNPDWVFPPDVDLLERFLATGAMRLLNVAPEMSDRAIDVIRRATSHGVVVGCGHAKPSAECLRRAIGAGLRYAIHLGNGPTGSSTKAFHDGGMLEETLRNDDVIATVIIDGYHVHPQLVRDFIERKGIERMIGVSDAGFALGPPKGEFEVFGIKGAPSDGGDYLYVVRPDESKPVNPRSSDTVALFGSAVDQLRVLEVTLGLLLTEMPGIYHRRHAAKTRDEALAEAVAMLATNPAKLLGLDDRGSIRPGARADLFVARVDAKPGDARVEIQASIVGGTVIEREARKS